MKKDNLKPPAKDLGNKAHEYLTELFKTISGGAINPLINYILPSLHQKQFEEWCNNIYLAIIELEEKKLSLNELQNNPEFISILKESYVIASKTHQIEKLKILKNSILNSIDKKYNFDTKIIFTKLIDRLSLSHLIIFSIIHDNYTEIKDLEKYTRIWKKVKELSSQLEISRDEFVFILKELELNSLIKLSDNIVDIEIVRESENFVSGSQNKELPYLAITGLGNGFYNYITENKELDYG